MLPPRILRFFECSTSEYAVASEGQVFQTEYRRIKVEKSEKSRKATENSFFYGFLLNYYASTDYCNTLYLLEDPLTANIISSIHKGTFYLPSNHGDTYLEVGKSLRSNGYGKMVVE